MDWEEGGPVGLGGGRPPAYVFWALKRAFALVFGCLGLVFGSHALPVPACVSTGRGRRGGGKKRKKKAVLLTWQRFPVVKPGGYRRFGCQLSAESCCCCCWLAWLRSPRASAVHAQLTQPVRKELTRNQPVNQTTAFLGTFEHLSHVEFPAPCFNRLRGHLRRRSLQPVSGVILTLCAGSEAAP